MDFRELIENSDEQLFFVIADVRISHYMQDDEDDERQTHHHIVLAKTVAEAEKKSRRQISGHD